MSKLTYLVILSIFLLFLVKNSFQFKSMWKKIAVSRKNNNYSYEIKYFDTYLDHFSYRNYSSTFKLRYVISQTYFKPGGAILFLCGCEEDILDQAIVNGFLWELAKELSAMLVFAEHRYYGESLPFGDKSSSTPEYFGYLSSEQALADYAELITYLKGSITGAQSSAVIAFGGSYGGMLAAWFRQKYPNIVAGALASSAPVLMVDNIKNCSRVYKVITNTYRIAGSENCTSNIRRFWNLVSSMNNSEGLAKLSQIFHAPLDDVLSFMSFIRSQIFEFSQFNYPYHLTYPPWPVKRFCEPLSNDLQDPNRLLEGVYEGLLRNYNINFNPSDDSKLDNFNLWEIQICTELPLPMCSNGVTDMFYPENFNETSYDNKCLTNFKVKPRWEWGQIQFWRNQLKAASNIIFSNGLLDPWSAGGVFSSESDSIKIITIPSGAHTFDLLGNQPEDPSDVRRARKKEKLIIQKWIAKRNKVDQVFS